MSMDRLMNQPLTVQSVGGSTTDVYGNTVVSDLGAPVAAVGYLEQFDSVEHLVDRDTTVTKWHAYLPFGTVVGPLDYLNFSGQKFQVDGEPWHVYNPRTKAVSHIQCKLEEVS